MSDTRDVPTLYSDDLASTNSRGKRSRDVVAVLEEENRRLLEENRLLRECIIHTQKNASLKTANIISSILTWSDGNLSQVFIRKILSDFDTDSKTGNESNADFYVNSSRNKTNPTIRLHKPTPNASHSSVQPGSAYSRSRDDQREIQSSRIIFNENLTDKRNYSSSQNDTDSPVQLNKFSENTGDRDGRSKSPAKLMDAHQSRSWEQQPIATQTSFKRGKEEDSWASMFDVGTQKPSNLNTGSLDKSKGGSKLQDSEFGDDKTFSEGYGSQLHGQHEQSYVGDKTGHDVIGEPIAASTPRKKSGNKDSSLGVSLFNRPIDKIIGVRPTVSELQLQKLSKLKPNKRLIGEIAFQLDRRILEYVFSQQGKGEPRKKESGDPKEKRRYYGFSMNNMGQMIRKEARDSETGKIDNRKELAMRYRFGYVMKTLMQLGYNLELHGHFSQDIVNKYGLLTGPPDKNTVQNSGLEDPVILRILMSQMIEDEDELNNVLVLLDCLCLLSFDDKNQLFMW